MRSFKLSHEATSVMDGVTFLDVLKECLPPKKAYAVWNWLVSYLIRFLMKNMTFQSFISVSFFGPTARD